MIYEIFQMVVLLLNIAAFGYYLYMAGKIKGMKEAGELFFKYLKEDR